MDFADKITLYRHFDVDSTVIAVMLYTFVVSGDKYNVTLDAQRSRVLTAELNSSAEISAYVQHVPKGCENLMLLKVYREGGDSTDYVFACKQRFVVRTDIFSCMLMHIGCVKNEFLALFLSSTVLKK